MKIFKHTNLFRGFSYIMPYKYGLVESPLLYSSDSTSPHEVLSIISSFRTPRNIIKDIMKQPRIWKNSKMSFNPGFNIH